MTAIVAADLLGDRDRDIVCRTGDDRLDGVVDGDGIARRDAELGGLCAAARSETGICDCSVSALCRAARTDR